MRRIIGLGLCLIAILTAGVFYWWQQPRAGAASDPNAPRLLVLGLDGMDPALLQELMDAGKMPNFSRLAEEGTLSSLQTSMPPQSPVAWSNMISGSDPGTHQIYDFIHRDPNPPEEFLAVKPYLSTSDVVPPEEDGLGSVDVGRWSIPVSLSAAEPRLLRQGSAFWDALAEQKIKSVIYRVPANYPPPGVSRAGYCSCLCGMGTPDLLESYGIFTLFTPDAPAGGRDVGGGRFARWASKDYRFIGTLKGPRNPLLKPDAETGLSPEMTIDFEVVRDPEANVGRIEIQGTAAVLKQGEWSEWVPIAFETGLPGNAVLETAGQGTSVPCMVRFYMKQVHPKLEVYVTPLNIDPKDPINPVSTPPEFSAELADRTGRFYTVGIPQDTKALREEALTEDEFLVQSRIVLEERVAQYREALKEFDSGCLFYYFGAIDLLSHMFWRDRDPGHPGRIDEQVEKYAYVIEDCYVEMDGLLGEALEALDDDDTIIVMSDHGFTGFRRGFNLNSWLVENGYIRVFPGINRDEAELFMNVDWTGTRAYAMGLNGLYVNLRGREKNGIVDEDEYDALLSDIAEKLLEVRDDDGSVVIDKVYKTREIYPGADPNIAPDLLIGYARNYRASWSTALGGMPYTLIEDNLDRWSGDHCNAQHLVPGIVATNRKLNVDDPALSDVAPTVLQLFGVESLPSMTGRRMLVEANHRDTETQRTEEVKAD